MDLFSPRHLLIVLVIVLLVFGTKKLKTIGSDLGNAVRGFKNSMKDAEDASSEASKPEDAKQIETADKPAEKVAEKVAEKPAERPVEKDKDKVTHA